MFKNVPNFSREVLCLCGKCNAKLLKNLGYNEKIVVLSKAILVSQKAKINFKYSIPVVRGFNTLEEAKALAIVDRRMKKADRKEVKKVRRKRRRKSNDIFDLYTRVDGSFRSRK